MPFAIKTPSNELVNWSMVDQESICADEFVKRMAGSGCLQVPEEYKGPEVFDLLWADLSAAGYQVVGVEVEVWKDGVYQIPILHEIGSQRELGFIDPLTNRIEVNYA